MAFPPSPPSEAESDKQNGDYQEVTHFPSPANASPECKVCLDCLTVAPLSSIILDMETTTQGARKMSYYRLYTDSSKTDYRTKGNSPTKALRELADMAGMELASQDGRYGKTTTGQSVSAMTEPWGRVDSPDARTTRV